MDAGVTISIVAILIVAAIAWKAFGGKEDWERLRHRLGRNEPRD